MAEIKIEIDERESVDDLESGNHTNEEKINHIAVSPDGSIVATFNPGKL
jgi:hypothetical protein